MVSLPSPPPPPLLLLLLLGALELSARGSSASLHPESRYGHCSVLVDDQLWVIGGSQRLTGTLDSRVLVFDPVSRQYTHAMDVGLPGLEGHSCSVTPGGFAGGYMVYIVGGWSNETGIPAPTRKAWMIHATNAHTSTTMLLPQLPAPLRRHSAVVTQMTEAIYVWGGSHGGPDNSNNTNQLLRLGLNPRSSAWEIVLTTGTPPSPRYGHTATLNSFVWQHFEGYMAVVGGRDCNAGPNCAERSRDGYLSDVYVLDLDKLSWLAATPEMGPGGKTNGLEARYGHTAVLIGDAGTAQLCVLAGTTLNSSCAERHGGDVSGCVYHSDEILCTHSGWQTGNAHWSTVPAVTGHGPISRDRHTTTLVSRPSAPCVDCGHGEPRPVTHEYRWLDAGGFHSGSPISTKKIYGYGVHELHFAPGVVNPWSWTPVWPE
eukprot:COSAG02_NODE_56_length_43700_cov_33.650765_28_plen_429_part_00